MERTRVHLDNPAFVGRLRHEGHSPAYVSRPIPQPAKIIHDVVGLDSLSSKAESAPPTKQQLQQIHDFVTMERTTSHDAIRPVGLTPPQQYRSPQKSLVLKREAAIHQQKLLIAKQLQPNSGEKPKSPKSKLSLALYTMAAVVFVIGVGVSLNGLRTNRQVAAQVQHLSSQNDSEDSGSHPSTKQLLGNDISGYVVAPNLPRYIDIPKLAVHARALSLGVTSHNQLKAPGNVYDAGWYNASAQPGQPGAMLLDGHISSWTTKGVFYGLNKLVNGDSIVITRGDDKTFTYTVVKSVLFDAAKVDMSSLLVSQDTAKPGLNLISCSGEVIPGTSEFNKRLAVYAVME